MRVVSVNVGRPKAWSWRGREVTSGILKRPIDGRVRVATLGLDGDGQADRRVHGGVSKAVYIYPHEHYAFWRDELGIETLEPGAFGENLTTTGLDEATTRVGDRLAIGTAELVVTEPRLPCRNLSMRFDRSDMVKRFLESGRTGFYLSVAAEGEVGVGDTIDRVPAGADAPTIESLVARHQH